MAQLSLLARALVFYGAKLPNHPRKWWIHGHLRKALNIQIDQDIEVVREGFRWSLNPADFEHSGYFWLGSKDPWDIYHLLKMLPTDAVILDVGANFGYYSIRLASELGPNCQVHAFEPNPVTHNRLLKHIHWNGFERIVKVHKVAVSDFIGQAHMVERADNSGASRIGLQGEQGIVIDVTTLDKFADAENLKQVDFIKIDVEGYEEHLLKGASQMIDRFKPIILIELWPPGLAKVNSSVEAVVAQLRTHSYQFREAKYSTLRPVAQFPNGVNPINIFCLPPTT